MHETTTTTPLLLVIIRIKLHFCTENKTSAAETCQFARILNKTVQGQCATPCTTLFNPYYYEIINYVYSV